MGKIKQLSKEVINQIAAGEIVQRNGHHNLMFTPFSCFASEYLVLFISEINVSIARMKDHQMQ